MIQGVAAKWSFSSLSATESCKSKDLQDFLFLCFGSPPFWGIKNFCLPLYKVVSYQLNFGIKQINGSYNIVVFLTICISYANNCFTL